MLRLLHFAEEGDTSGYFPQLARHHDPRRFQVQFATLRTTAPDLVRRFAATGTPCFSCGARSRLEYPMAAARLAAFLKREQFQIFHAHLFDPAVVGLPAAWLAGTPLRVLTRHYSDYHTRIRRPLHVLLDRFCTLLAHRVIAVSQHTAEHLIEVEHAPARKVVAIPNGIDFDRVRRPEASEVQRLRRELAPHGEMLLLQMARLHPEKGHEYLFRALPRILREAGRPVKLLLAGAGSAEPHYRECVASLGIRDAVEFLGFRQDAPAVIAASDVLVLPSVAEAFGLVVAEAIYLGTPVVASRVGGIPEIVREGVDGILVPPGDSDALADAILRIARGEALLEGSPSDGARSVRERFAFADMVRRYEAVYQEALDEKGVGALG